MRVAIHAEEKDTQTRADRETPGVPPAPTAPTAPTPDAFRFADCEVRMPSREIVRAGNVQKVERLSFDLIVYLISNRGRVVTKDELLRSVWGNMFVSDSVITQGVMKARRVLGDDGQARSFIRTVHRVGYKFDEHVLYAVPLNREVVNATASQMVLIAQPANLDEATRVAFAHATDLLASELSHVGLSVRYVDCGELPGPEMRIHRRA
jgi:DNA-binding winged helix-turn-helix (wHTH) protein